MTQSHPTNFHIFERKHILNPGESIDDWREITEAEKVKLEKSDSEWVAPEQWLIDRWKMFFDSSYDADYNKETGFFEACGLKDITTEQAMAVDKYGALHGSNTQNYFASAVNQRINYPKVSGHNSAGDLSGTFQNNKYIEVALCQNGKVTSNTFQNCDKLKCVGYKNQAGNVFSNLYLINGTSPETTYVGCKNLEIVYGTIRGSGCNINVSESPKLTLENFQHWISKAVNTSPITITVHPEVYAKLTDEGNEEWHQVLTDAMEKQITFATS